MSDVALRATGLRKAFGTDGVFEDVDLELRAGETLLLLGPNGVGKTVLLSCLAGSERASAGDVSVFDTPVAEDCGNSYAILLQDSMAVDTLSGSENVAFYADLHPKFTDRWERYLDALELTEDLDRRVKHYSGGMRRKLELALVLSLDVPVYLLDEPTAGVDRSMVRRFHDLIHERQRDGASMVVTSHRAMDADLADRVAFMPDGGLSAIGTPEELMDEVPTVVRVTGLDLLDVAESHVLGNRVFPLGGEARGFLPPDTSLDEFRDRLAEAGHTDPALEAIEPTYTDLFNYYVHVRPTIDP